MANYNPIYYNIQQSLMKIFAGTYQGNVFILQGTPTDLKIKVVKPVSENSIRTMTYAFDELLVGGYDQQLRAINPSTGLETKESKQSIGIINCIRNINKNLAVLGLENGTIRFWDRTSWSSRKDLRQHKKAVTDIKIDKKGLMMVSAAGRQIIFWNISNLKSLYHFRFDYDIEHILLVDSFEYLFIIGDKTVRQVSTEDNKELFKFTLNDKIQCGLIFQQYIVLATEKGQIKIYAHNHYEYCLHFKAHEVRIKDIKTVSLDQADFLVTADSNGEIKVWDILQFLKGVDSISQDYNLEGLKPLSSVQTKQRVICIEVQSNQSQQHSQQQSKKVQPQAEHPEQDQSEQEQQAQPVHKKSTKKQHKKLIAKQKRKQNKNKKKS